MRAKVRDTQWVALLHAAGKPRRLHGNAPLNRLTAGHDRQLVVGDASSPRSPWSLRLSCSMARSARIWPDDQLQTLLGCLALQQGLFQNVAFAEGVGRQIGNGVRDRLYGRASGGLHPGFSAPRRILALSSRINSRRSAASRSGLAPADVFIGRILMMRKGDSWTIASTSIRAKSLKQEIGGPVVVGLAHADQARSRHLAGWLKGIGVQSGRFPVECGHGKNPVSVQDRLEHTPVSLLKNVEGQQGVWEEHRSGQRHDRDFFGQTDFHEREWVEITPVDRGRNRGLHFD